MLLSILEGGFHNPRVPLRPVIAAARDQPDVLAVALHPQAVAVVLHFVEPVGTVGDGSGSGGDAELKHGDKIGTAGGLWNSGLYMTVTLGW
jgi:hypothetical protein